MKRILVLAMMLIFAVTPAVMAQGNPGGCDRGPRQGMRCDNFGPRGGEFGMMSLLDKKAELNLTDEQITRIQKINFEHRSLMIDVRADLDKAMLTMHQEMSLDNPDKNKVLLTTKEISSIKAKMAEMQVNHRFAMREVLTKEQLDKLKELRDNPPEMMTPGPGKRGEGHGMGHDMGQGQKLRDGSCIGGF